MSVTCSDRWLEVSAIFAAITSVISIPVSCRSARTMHTAARGGTWPMLPALSGTVTTSSVGGCHADQGKGQIRRHPALTPQPPVAFPGKPRARRLGRPLLPLRYLRRWERMRSRHPDLIQQPAEACVAHAVLRAPPSAAPVPAHCHRPARHAAGWPRGSAPSRNWLNAARRASQAPRADALAPASAPPCPYAQPTP